MQHTLPAIRAGRPRTHFTVPAARPRLARLGLRRPAFAPAARGVAVPLARPRDQIRRAARSCVTAARTQAGPQARHPLRSRPDGVRWSRQVGGARRRARPRSAAPWRA